MPTLEVHVPDEPLLSLKETPEQFAEEIKLLAAVKLFELGRLSSGRAAQLAGLPRVAFLLKLQDYRVSPFGPMTQAELKRDVDNA